MPHRRLSFGIEPLEERRLLSIVWTNRGSDAFDTYYGASAGTARSIVDKALADWNRLIDLNWDDDHNPSTNPYGDLPVNVSAYQFTDGTRGATSTSYSYYGWPVSAVIQLDDNGGGTGWYFGLNDDHVFTSLATPFHGTIPGSGDDNDFYRTITHELGHAVGISTYAGAAISSYFTNVGTDQVDGTSALKRFLNSGGPYGVQVTLTTSGGGHYYEGPVDPLYPNEPIHPNELMNAGRTVNPPPTTRQLVSDLTIKVLADAYDYNVLVLPSQVDTLYVARNASTSQLVVRGLQGTSNDSVTLTRSGNDVEVLVNGTHEHVVFADVTSIAITGGDGSDTAYFDLTGGDPIPASNATFDGGNGTDTIRSTGSGSFALSNSSLSTPYGSVTLTSAENGYLTGGTGADTLNATSFTGPVTLYGGSGNDLLYGGSGNDTLYGQAGIDYLYGLAGNDLLDGGDDNDLFGLNSAGLGSDTVVDGGGSGDFLYFYGLSSGVTVDLGVTTPQSIPAAGLTLTLSSASAIERAYGTDYNDVLRGNALGNLLYGYSGDDTLVGLSGADALYGVGGNDSLEGGDDNDTYYFNSTGLGSDTIVDSGGVADMLYFYGLGSGVTVDLAVTTPQSIPAAGLTLTLASGSSMNDIYGTDYADTLRGNAERNTIYGHNGNDTIYGLEGNDSLVGGGGDDTYYLNTTGLGNDTVVDSGGSADALYFYGLGSGVSVDLAVTTPQSIPAAGLTLTLASGSSMDVLYGTNYADTLRGNAQANTVYGYNGNDTIYGLEGNDSLDGGDGNDAYYFDTTGLGSDTVVDSAGGADALRFYGLSSGVSVDLGVTTPQSIPAAGLTLTLTSGSAIEYVYGTNYNDLLRGNSLSNLLYGYGGDDTLYGLAGADNLYGLAGNDLLDGGDDSDTYYFTTTGLGSDTVVDSGGSSDTLYFYGLASGVTVDLAVTTPQSIPAAGLTLTLASGSSMEVVYGTAYADTLRGNGQANTVNGSSGNDTLYGLEGNDSLVGGDGDDTFYFNTTGLGNDTVSDNGGTADALYFYGLGSGVTVDLGVTYQQSIPAAGLTLTLITGSSMEVVYGTDYGDDLHGNARANTIYGYNGDDDLVGMGGNDLLDGGADRDSYAFNTTGLGSDTVVDSGGSTDELYFYGLSSGVTVDLGVTTPQSIPAAGLTLTLTSGSAIEEVWGTNYSDLLRGNSLNNIFYGWGGDDTVYGLAGADNLYGMAGNDLLDGGDDSDSYYFTATGLGSDTVVDSGGSSDTLNFYGLASGVTVDLAVTTPQSIPAAGLTLTLTSGSSMDVVYGTEYADTLRGNAQANTIQGYEGNDTIYGQEGNDLLLGNLDSDTYVFSGTGLGSDTIDDTAGTNTLDFSALGAAATIDLYLTTAQTVSSGNLTLTLFGATWITNVQGTAYADTIRGNILGNGLWGNGGNDSIDGIGGDDTIYGGNGDDTLYSDWGTDRIYGEDGNDWLYVDDAASGDTADGGNGSDTGYYNSGDTTVNIETLYLR